MEYTIRQPQVRQSHQRYEQDGWKLKKNTKTKTFKLSENIQESLNTSDPFYLLLPFSGFGIRVFKTFGGIFQI